MSENTFTEEQQSYLQGFALGTDVARKIRSLPVISDSAASGTNMTLGGQVALSDVVRRPEQRHYDAQDRQTGAGGKLCAEEQAKREKNPLDMWDEMQARARSGEFPKGTDVFLQKFHGLFYVAPAQDAYMCRMRFPGGDLRSYQFRGLADLADAHAGGYVDVTTRANLQFREIPAEGPIHILLGLRNLGIINVGAGGDNIRNVTASPLSGIDARELIETLPLAQEMHHYIINNREMYGLPRKFNIAFDGGGTISALEDTNDIGFTAVEVAEEIANEEFPAGVYFQLTLGGITGHEDFARYTGVLLKPEQCVEVAAAIVRVFIDSGDRTDRKKARLKYVLDDWGFEKFLTKVEEELGRSLPRFPLETCKPREDDDRLAHLDVRAQKQPGLNYVGLVLPVGRITSEQMREIARLADCYGSGTLRLTVWQNLLIPDIPDEAVAEVTAAIEAIGLDYRATSVRAGLIACTGAAGCKYAASHTKQHALQIAEYVESELELDTPVNIHLTGCHHSCAQHYIGDLGLIGANVEDGEDMVEGYHMFVGGGWGNQQAIGRELLTNIRATDAPAIVCQVLRCYLQRRESPEQTFVEFAQSKTIEELKTLLEPVPAMV